MKEFLRKLLNVQPKIIERTIYVYPKPTITDFSQESVDHLFTVKLNKWFEFNTGPRYYYTDYYSDIFKCACDFCGPSTGKKIAEGIDKDWDIQSFFENKIPEGSVVLDYINSKESLQDKFKSFNNLFSDTFELSEEEFKAYEYMQKKMLDLSIFDSEMGENAKRLVDFVGRFVRKETKKS